MNARIIVAAVVGGIAMFFSGFVFYGLALDSFMKANIVIYEGLMKDPPAMIPLALHNLVFAWFMAFVFDHWAGIRTLAGGLVGGGLIMFSIVLANELGFLAFMNIYQGLGIVAVNVVVVTLMGAITGGVIGLILGKMAGEPQEA